VYQDVIFITAFIVVLFIIWIALKLNIRVRKARAEHIKQVNLADYVTFVNNFTKAEEAEKKGNRSEALRLFRRALERLEDEKNPDDITLETMEEVRARIAALEEQA
jgi:hypothetical protein